jgi:hypothetical protein
VSKPTGHKPRHNPAGKYEVECAWCGVKFRTNNARTRYCTYKHKEMADNRHYYREHRKEVILAVMLRQSRVRHKKKKKLAPQPDLDQMSNEELLAYVRDNPHAVRVKKR